MSNIIIRIEEDGHIVTIDVPKQNSQTFKVACFAAMAAKEAADKVLHNPSSVVQSDIVICHENDVKENTREIAPFETDKAPEPKIERKDDMFKFRERIPNNTVDLSELKIGSADQENALVRCPECGQSHAILPMDDFNYYLMVRDFEKNEFVIVGHPMHVSESLEEELKNLMYEEFRSDKDGKGVSITKEEYFQDMQTFLKHRSDSNFVVNDGSSILCPVCHKISNFYQWKEAFAHPEQYFEFNEICDACGGEMVEKNTKKSKDAEFKLVCEKCGHKKKK